MRKWWSKV